LRDLLIAEIVVRDRDHSLADKSIVRVEASRRQRTKPVR
jgi:hypothetical protein